jgi:hypothetical protein
MHVNDKTLFVGVDTEFGKLAGIKQQVTIVSGVLVGLSQVRRL